MTDTFVIEYLDKGLVCQAGGQLPARGTHTDQCFQPTLLKQYDTWL